MEHNGCVKRLKEGSDYHKCNSIDPMLPLSEAYMYIWNKMHPSFTF